MSSPDRSAVHQRPSSRRMGSSPLGSLLFKLSIPGIIGMFIQSTYNVVDTMFVGRIGDGSGLGVDAIIALSAAFPVQLILIAIAVGTGVGVASLISRLLGSGRREEACAVANNAIFLSLLYWVITAVIGILFAPRILALFVNDTAVVDMGSQYLRIIMAFSGSLFLFITAERILQAQGKTFTPMVVLALTAILNIFLDPVFIFGFWFVPAMGVKGAAVATVIARSIGTIAILAILLKGRNELPLSMRRFLPRWKLLRDIYAVGGPTMLIQILGSIMLAFMNYILGPISLTAIAVLGLYYKVQSFVMMPIFGIVHGFLPVVGYNYGAGRTDRVKKVLVIAMKWAFVMTLLGFVMFMLFPGQIISVFNDNDTLRSVGEKGFRRIALLFFLNGPLVIMPSFFQGLGKGGKSLLILLTQRVLILFPAVLLIDHYTEGVTGIWLAFPIATVWAFFLGAYLIRRELRELGDRKKKKAFSFD